jgi:hypothetical protein
VNRTEHLALDFRPAGDSLGAWVGRRDRRKTFRSFVDHAVVDAPPEEARHLIALAKRLETQA